MNHAMELVNHSSEEIATLAWIVLFAVIAIVVAVVALIRSGRSVGLAWFGRRRER